MHPSDAELLAIKALGWAAADGEALSAFLKLSGLEVSDLRARAADPELLAGLIDFVLTSDAHTQGFCAMAGVTPEELHEARRALPGAPSY